jgi:hypothetical protein
MNINNNMKMCKRSNSVAKCGSSSGETKKQLAWRNNESSKIISESKIAYHGAIEKRENISWRRNKLGGISVEMKGGAAGEGEIKAMKKMKK